jgi:hypothetical protein
MDILETSPRFDRAKAGVLKNPVKTVCQFNGKIKKVLQFVGLVTGKSELASSVQRTRRYIQADDGPVGEAAAMARTSYPSPQPSTRTPPCIAPRLPSHSSRGGAGAPFSQGVSPIRYLFSQSISMTTRRKKRLDQKSDSNHAKSQTDQPKRSAPDQD